MKRFDQIIKGKVFIKKGECNNYIITFQSQKDLFLVYQTFSYDSPAENKNRSIENCFTKNMGETDFRKVITNDDFTPTTIMQIKG